VNVHASEYPDGYAAVGQRRDCDFWGPTANLKDGAFDHISSYFLVFRKPVLCDSAFLAFFQGIERQSTAQAVIDFYEIPLSRLLVNRGFNWGALMPVAAEFGSFAMAQYVQKDIHTWQSSWLKTRVVRENPFQVVRLGRSIQEIAAVSGYPRALIDGYMLRMLGTASPECHSVEPPPPPQKSEWSFEGHGIGVYCHRKRGKPDRQLNRRWDWLKVYARMWGVPVFALALPVRR
jgi:hypothetical protein